MKTFVLLFALVLCVCSAELLQKSLIDFYGKNTKADIIIFMKDNFQVSDIQHKGKSIHSYNVDERANILVKEFMKRAQETQKSLQNELKENKLKFDVMWNVNGLLVRKVEKDLLLKILSTKQNTIDSVMLNHEVDIEEIEKKSTVVTEKRQIESNVEWVQAPAVCKNLIHQTKKISFKGKLGFKGKGILVGVGDTGLYHVHESLVNAYNGTIGKDKYDHNYNWGDPVGKTKAPFDSNGHGTHCSGTVAGGDKSSKKIGVAPKAKLSKKKKKKINDLKKFIVVL